MAALLDWEFAGWDARALDVAASLKGALPVGDASPTLTLDGVRHFLAGYRRHNVLEGEEIEAIPWLVRLRDAAAVLVRAGRGLAAGRAVAVVERMEAQRASARWLEREGARLVDTLAGALAASGEV